MIRKIKNAIQSYRRLAAAQGHAIAVRMFVLPRLRWKGPIRIKVLGESIFVRAGSHDLSVVRSSLGTEFAPLDGVLPRDFAGLIVDAGGYIGTAAIRMARLYPKATVVTIEPSQDNYDVLSRNIAPFPNIKPVRAALVAANRPAVRLSSRGTGEWGYTIVENPDDNQNTAFLHLVDTVTLADIKAKFGFSDIGIIKLDIEGAEKELFDSRDPDLAASRAVFVELHDRIVGGCTASFEAFSKDRVVKGFDGEKYLSLSSAVH